MPTRRRFLGQSLAFSSIWASGRHLFGATDANALEARLRSRDTAPDVLGGADSPFTLGVASGDPWADSVVLWTRLALDPTHGGGMPDTPIEVTWQLATDDKLSKVVKRGRATATAEWAHSVHVEVNGLEPDRWYWYQFRAGDHLSPIGRTRTLPKPGAKADQLRFAFACCQNYEVGYFTAYKAMARQDLDVVFHLGDYLYEAAPIKDRPRLHVSPELTTLQDYRDRYAQYATDPDLQAARAAFPWIVTPDDHEVANNYASFTSAKNDPVEVFSRRRAAAYHAYYEHQPLRASSVPKDAFIQLYRQFQYGDLAAFYVLDTRQYRSDQACDDGTKALCEAAVDPTRTMMGDTQERWFFSGLDRSQAAWNIVPQQVMMGAVDQSGQGDPRYSMDQWSGYPAATRKVMEFFGTRRPSNPVVLTGDIHSNWVNDLKLDFRSETSPTVATEFVATSITSGGDGQDLPGRMTSVMRKNPFVKFYNNQRGYVSCQVTRGRMTADYHVVDKVSTPDGKVTTRASFVVEDGWPGAKS